MPRARSTHPLVQLFESSPSPMYLLDEQRRIVGCNRACAEWLQFDTERLLGQRCDYATHETAEIEVRAAAALCPPPETFAGEVHSAAIVWGTSNGVAETRRATFVPLRHEEPTAILVIIDEESSSAPPVSSDELADSAELHQKLQVLAQQMRSRYRLDKLVGDSPAIRRVREQVEAASASSARVLIVGPPGSGREYVARTIVYAGQVDELAVLPLDCSKLDIDSLENWLAVTSRRGLSSLPAAWLLLDVDQAPADVQKRLAAELPASNTRIRILATARQPLIELAASGMFDPELAHALSILVIQVPPLRQRREDIPILAQRLVEEFNATAGRQLAGFSPGALDRLCALPWNGDTAELTAVVQEACRTVTTVWIGEGDLPSRVRAVVSAGMYPRNDPETIRLDDYLLEIEKELIQRAMRQAKANKAYASRLLGISRARLLRRLEQLGLISRAEAEIDFQPDPESSSMFQPEPDSLQEEP